jgi:hypothetical protein
MKLLSALLVLRSLTRSGKVLQSHALLIRLGVFYILRFRFTQRLGFCLTNTRGEPRAPDRARVGSTDLMADSSAVVFGNPMSLQKSHLVLRTAL